MLSNALLLMVFMLMPWGMISLPTNKCKSIVNPTDDVEWWAVITQPKGNGFFYADSNSNTEGAKGPFVIYADAPKNIERHFITHINIGVENNKEAFQNLQGEDPRKIQLPKFFDENADATKLTVFQLWTNDQPADNLQEGTVIEQNQDPNYSWAHSKHMVSLSTMEENYPGFMIIHSFPSTPVNLYPKAKDFGSTNNNNNENVKLEPVVFRYVNERYARFKDVLVADGKMNPNEGNTNKAGDTSFLFSQHAFCFNFANGNDVMDALKTSYVRVTDYNFNPDLISFKEDLYATLKSIIKGTLNTNCEASWGAGKKLEDSYNDIATCTKVYQIGNLGQVIAHVPTKDTQDNEDKSDVIFTSLGPLPWIQVAQSLQSSLFLLNWKNSWLPSIVKSSTTPYAIYVVERMTASVLNEDPVVWKHGNMHEKIALSYRGTKSEASLKLHQNDEKTSDWICFGDSNHRTSEITHAGLTFCFQNADIHYQIFTWIDKVNMVNYIPEKEPYKLPNLIEIYLNTKDEPTFTKKLTVTVSTNNELEEPDQETNTNKNENPQQKRKYPARERKSSDFLNKPANSQTIKFTTTAHKRSGEALQSQATKRRRTDYREPTVENSLRLNQYTERKYLVF